MGARTGIRLHGGCLYGNGRLLLCDRKVWPKDLLHDRPRFKCNKNKGNGCRAGGAEHRTGPMLAICAP